MAELFIAIVFFIIGIFVSRWVFRINEIVAIQKSQLYILTMMARQQGIPREALNNALGANVDPLWKKYVLGKEEEKTTKQ